MIDFNQLDSYRRVNYICQYIQALVGLIGVCGNLLTITVFSRKRLRKFSYSFYSKAMACSDILILAHSFRHWSKNILGADLDLINDFFCKIGEFQPYTASIASLWLLCLISFDRLITIVYPRKFHFFKLRSVQFILVTVVLIYSVLTNIQLPLFYHLESLNNSTNVTLVCYFDSNVAKFHLWLILINIIVVNIFINNALNVRMIFYVFKSRRRVANSTNSTSHRDRRFAISSISLNLCCLACKMPLTIGLLVLSYMDIDYDLYEMLFTICISISTIDNADSFFVNMIVNTSFYDEFMRMIKIGKDDIRK